MDIALVHTTNSIATDTAACSLQFLILFNDSR